MKPQPSQTQSKEIKTSKIELASLLAARHELLRLVHEINRERFEAKFGESYSDKVRPDIGTRLMVAWHYPECVSDLSTASTIRLVLPPAPYPE